MATLSARKSCWSGFFILCSVVVVVAENDFNIGGSLIRNRRFPGTQQSCLEQRLTCTFTPAALCDSGVCLGVEETVPLRICVSKCGPADNNEINGTVSVDNATQTSTPNITTTSHWDWEGDPAYCSKNFHCRNGGNCDPIFKNLKGSDSHGKCICAANYTGTLCQHECTLDCPGNITCEVKGSNNTQYCICPGDSDIPGCEDFTTTSQYIPPEPEAEPIWMWPVIAVAIVLLLILLIYIVLLKLRWRSLMVTKMFHSLQPYEDDDDKLFDGFVSFISSKKANSQSEDEKFVYRVLRPALEEQSAYKLCIHQRDFPPGEAIVNNIIWAVENSRRTILVLSPLYLESGWTRLEYQKALEEMSKLRHKIIPIIFEDISNMTIGDPTLKKILSSVTYIKYPQPSNVKETKRFWSMLHLALPKIRSVDTEKSPKSITTTTTTTTTKASLETESSETITGKSWKSTRTDVTDIPMVTLSNEKTTTKDAVIDINQIKVIADTKLNNKHEMNNEKVEKYTKLNNEHEMNNRNAEKYTTLNNEHGMNNKNAEKNI